MSLVPVPLSRRSALKTHDLESWTRETLQYHTLIELEQDMDC